MARGLWPCLEPHVERSPPVCLLGLGHARLTGRRFPVWWRHLFANLWCMPGCHARELARSATVAPAEAWVGRCCRCCADAVWRWERRTVRLQSTEPENGRPASPHIVGARPFADERCDATCARAADRARWRKRTIWQRQSAPFRSDRFGEGSRNGRAGGSFFRPSARPSTHEDVVTVMPSLSYTTREPGARPSTNGAAVPASSYTWTKGAAAPS